MTRVRKFLALLLLVLAVVGSSAAPALAMACMECGSSAGVAVCLVARELDGYHFCVAWTECDPFICFEFCTQFDWCAWA